MTAATLERRRHAMCEGKTRYPTRRHAKRSLRWMARHAVTRGLEVYRCQFCPGWHLGHARYT